MARRKTFKSIIELKENIDKMNELLTGLITFVMVFQKFTSNPKFGKYLNSQVDGALEKITFDEKKTNQIYELCFIRLYASFEAFMTDYLRELYIKFPNSLPRDKKISVDDILDWKTQKSTRTFIIDHIAIENSYDLPTWKRTLKSGFGIEVFKDEKHEQLFNLLNLMRNMIAHSGRKFNSKISRDSAKFIKKKTDKLGHFEVTDFELDDEKLYENLVSAIKDVIEQIENKNVA
ncbi:hypothetical protein [Winogradskyella sp.]|uniref:hypothetical protein n=1 Tax=Winogradskyella sp. TaxID=1883156 RepID=UPI003AA895BD